ncbi:GNAT family N-acetyltransferase [Litchfieldia alkalitelluris]|uniref:GNAT family N-acetyltransferase n=1 Tax=Litchfieldia alkalitelluris TaxID=304268 RepID=UPI0009963164|nr:GNAT family protein [Litchfieldia alkalitelluris]
MDLKIRKAETNDAVSLINHTLIVLKESTYMLTTPEEFSTNVEKQVKRIESYQQEGNLLLVAEVDGRIIGTLDFELCSKKRISHIGYLSISIQEEYCNSGIGRKLMEELINFAKKHPKIEKVCLEVFSHNERAIHFYKKLGFKEEGRKIKFVKFDDGVYSDEIEMYLFV